MARRHGHVRTRRGLRCARHDDQSRAPGQRLRPQRLENLDHQRPGRRRFSTSTPKPATDEDASISTFIVERGMEGFSTGKKFSKMGMRASPTGELVFDNCKVPGTNRVGEENSSVKMMMRNLDIERITIAGISLGLARASHRSRHSVLQRAQAIRQAHRLFPADSGTPHRSLRLVRSLPLPSPTSRQNVGLGLMTGKEASMMAAKAKLQSAQMATQVCSRRDPDPGRLRLHARISGRALHARRQAHGNRRRHQRNSPPDHRAADAGGGGGGCLVKLSPRKQNRNRNRNRNRRQFGFGSGLSIALAETEQPPIPILFPPLRAVY